MTIMLLSCDKQWYQVAYELEKSRVNVMLLTFPSLLFLLDSLKSEVSCSVHFFCALEMGAAEGIQSPDSSSRQFQVQNKAS